MVFSYTVDLLFLIDIILIFNTAFVNSNLQMVDDRKVIAKKYLSGWFLIDIMSIMPFDLILESVQTKYNGVLRFAKMGRLYKLIKLTRLIRMLKMVRDSNKFLKFFKDLLSVTFGLQRLFFFCVILFMMCHIGACLWVLFP